MMRILDFFTSKHLELDKKIQHEKSRLNNSHQAVKSGVNLLIHASNALHLVAEENHAENYRK